MVWRAPNTCCLSWKCTEFIRQLPCQHLTTTPPLPPHEICPYSGCCLHFRWCYSGLLLMSSCWRDSAYLILLHKKSGPKKKAACEAKKIFKFSRRTIGYWWAVDNRGMIFHGWKRVRHIFLLLISRCFSPGRIRSCASNYMHNFSKKYLE